MTSCCVVVIGHVDHGKTALVQALTGKDTDRLAEEKARGLTIELGFAHRRYPSGDIDFIDTPGHADFVQTMVAGATGAAAALVAISAVDGPQAQTLEHLQIAELLGLQHIIVAVTKTDLVPQNTLDQQLAVIKGAMTGTPFAEAPLVPCSSSTSAGLAELDAALERLIADADLAAIPAAGFLPVDRVFSLHGRGTIATGTLLGHDITLGDDITAYPSGIKVSMRSLQSRGVAVDTAQYGSRVATNLRNMTVKDLKRGDVLATTGVFAASNCVDVRLAISPSRAVKHMQKVRVLFGTTSAVAQLRRYSKDPSFGQLRFNSAICGYAGQRAILRQLSPPETVGAVTFLDPQATPTRAGDAARLVVLQACANGAPEDITEALCAAEGGVALAKDITRLARISEEQVAAKLAHSCEWIDDQYVSPRHIIKHASKDLISRLIDYHHLHPLRSAAPHGSLILRGISEALQAYVEHKLIVDGVIGAIGHDLKLMAHDPTSLLTARQSKRMDDISKVYRAAVLGPPSPDTLIQSVEDQDIFDLLNDNGGLITLRNVALNQSLTLHYETLIQAETTLRASFPSPKTFTTSEARSELATSRRIIVPLLEHFDSIGVTKRTGDTRQMTE